MNSTEFTYWLQGFFELTDAKSLDEKQVAIIKEHLQLCFKKVTNDFYENGMPYDQKDVYPFNTNPVCSPTDATKFC